MAMDKEQVKLINDALDEISATKGIQKEVVINSLKEAMERAYRKQLGGEGNVSQNLSPADVRVTIDPDNGIIEMVQVKTVVEDVTDDVLEISIEDANEEAKARKEKKKYKAGDEFVIPADINDLRKALIMNIKSIFRQKQAEAEKEVLYEAFKDKLKTMITGRVEKVEETGVSVNIGRTSVFLGKRQLIGDERFEVGDSIKLFVSKVESSTKGARIVVSRADEGFLEALFNEEIRDIYDGLIIIKGIARKAGERSKVAVYSNDPNVDPSGACIGVNGSKIQKIVGQLGNGGSKEKIDVIPYSDNTALFIMESLKPAKILSINVDTPNKKATVIVNDDDLSLAIGKKGVNVTLASKLTGYAIDIKKLSEKDELGLEFVSYEEAELQELEAKAVKIREAQLKKMEATMSSLPGVPEGYVAPQARTYEEESSEELNEALNAEIEKEEEQGIVLNKVEETIVAPVKEEKVEEKPQVEETPVKEEAITTTNVKITTNLEALEKSLEEENKKPVKSEKKYSKKKSEDKKEESVVIDKDKIQKMDIYTQEELEELDKEEESEEYSDDEDVDYDEYDEYYDK